ncbi:MAG: radical SAM protein [Candidatus Woesearchaeota archaeon]
MKPLVKKNFYQVSISFTDNCNLKCNMCGMWKKRKKVFMSIKDAEFIAAFLNSLNVKKVTITGYGEQLTHPKFKEIVSIFQKYGFKLLLVTNGTLINKYPKKFFKNFSRIIISVDSLKKRIYNKIRGVDELTLIKHNIKILFSEKIPLTISMVLQHINYKEIRKMVNFCKKKGIKLVLYPAIDSPKMEFRSKYLSRKELNFIEKEVTRLEKHNVIVAPKYFISLLNRLKTKQPIKGGCIWPLYNTFILPNGNILSCCGSYPQTVCNIFKDNINDVYKRKIFAALKNSFFTNKRCNSCIMKWRTKDYIIEHIKKLVR